MYEGRNFEKYRIMISAVHFRKSVRKLRTQGFDLRICEPISYRKHLRIRGKKLKSTQIRKATTSLGCFFAIYKKNTFLRFIVST